MFARLSIGVAAAALAADRSRYVIMRIVAATTINQAPLLVPGWNYESPIFIEQVQAQ
jgi:hypothetical protein